MKKKHKIAIILALVALWAAFFAWRKVEKEAFERTAGSSNLVIEFEVKEGEGVRELAKSLENQGLIKHRLYFYYYLWRVGNHDKLQAGTYHLAPDMRIAEIAGKIMQGEIATKTVKLVVPEGLNNEKIFKLLAAKKPELLEEFKSLASCKCLNAADCACDKFSAKYDFIRQIPAGIDLEGYLFPDTYFIEEDDDAEALINKFLTNFEKKLRVEMAKNKDKNGMNLHQLITLASIVEREAKNEQDRKRVAGVLLNRLEIDMPLQVDATLSYILGEDRVKFHNKHIQENSPYNTYLNKGLPPGPIANPGMEAILATLYPEKTDCLFFLSDAETGEMFFAKTSEEQEINKRAHGL